MCRISCFIFKVNEIFIEHNPSKKIVIDEEESDGIDIDTIVNLEDLPRLVLVNEECGGLKVVVDCGELMTYATNESVISMWNNRNNLGKHDFACG